MVPGIFLTGCTSGGSLKSSRTIIGSGWAAPPEPYTPPEPLYCYKTLGDIECHRTQLSTMGSEPRLTGSHPESPQLDQDNDPSFFSLFKSRDEVEQDMPSGPIIREIVTDEKQQILPPSLPVIHSPVLAVKIPVKKLSARIQPSTAPVSNKPIELKKK